MTISSFYWLPNVLGILFRFTLKIPLGDCLHHLPCLDAETWSTHRFGDSLCLPQQPRLKSSRCTPCGLMKQAGA